MNATGLSLHPPTRTWGRDEPVFDRPLLAGSLRSHPGRVSIVYADSDPLMHDIVCPRLRALGIDVRSAYTAREMWSAARQSTIDLVIFDIMLPDADGLDLCRRIRRASDIPIIMVCDRQAASERVLGLELGADDWLVKPLDARELAARIRSILRRAAGVSRATAARHVSATFAGHTLKLSSRELLPASGASVQLSNSLFRLLHAFLASHGKVLSRDDLMYAAHGRSADGGDRAIDNHVVKLRQLLGDDGTRPPMIRTVRGAGYLFLHEVTWT